MKLVLTKVKFKFNKEEEVYKAATMGLAKYINSEGTANTLAIKVEPVMKAKMEETLVAKGWTKPNSPGGYRSGGSQGTPPEVQQPTEEQLGTNRTQIP